MFNVPPDLESSEGRFLEVTFLGKLATWVLYASLAFALVTAEGTAWPLVLVWIGVALALLAGLQYMARALAVVRRA